MTTLQQPKSTTPIIFLAFANDLVDDAAFLRGLKDEREKVRAALRGAEKEGLCQVIVEPNTTIKNILDTFQEFGDRIAIFHYAGHSNGFQLLLETQKGKNQSAHSEGLISFLSKQKGLKLTFLNGCSSRQQALELVESGMPAVIGTAQSINDDVATSLATRFYQGIGQARSIEQAWDEAVDEVKTIKGTANVRDLFNDGLSLDSSETSASENVNEQNFPWEVYYNDQSTVTKSWNLADASANILFGLPPIPQTHHLPKEPFIFPNYYERTHAEVFFGRSAEIRTLYDLATSDSAPPIILLHGKKGVGKSSLLAAGLQPRLETDFHVMYVRKGEKFMDNMIEDVLENCLEALKEKMDVQAQLKAEGNELDGLVESLQKLQKSHPSFREDFERFIAKAERQQVYVNELADVDDCHGLWHQIEMILDKPLIVLYDQADTMFLDSSNEAELETFFEELQHIFGDATKNPKGRIVVSFRESLVEKVETGLKEANVPYMKVPIDHLNRTQLIECVQGLTSTARLKTNYQLSIQEQNLPVVIADDLLEDETVSVTPIAQALLTELWRCAKESKQELVFTHEAYRDIREHVSLLEEYYDHALRKMVEMSGEEASEEEVRDQEGYILEALHQFSSGKRTIPLKPADVLRYFQGAKELEEDVYRRKLRYITEALCELRKAGFLIDAGEGRLQLAFDALAVFVSHRYQESRHDLQRINRALAYKMAEHQFDQTIILHFKEIEMIKEWIENEQMRNPTKAELEFIQVSEKMWEGRQEVTIELVESNAMMVRENHRLIRLLGLVKVGMLMMAQPKLAPAIALAVPFDNSPWKRYEQCKLQIMLMKSGLSPLVLDKDGEDYKLYYEAHQGYKQQYQENIKEGNRWDAFANVLIDEERNKMGGNEYDFSVILPNQLLITETDGEVEPIEIETKNIRSVSSFANTFAMVCTEDGLVTVWSEKGEKFLEIGDANPDAPNHYLSAFYDLYSGVLLLDTKQELIIYALTADSLNQYGLREDLPDQLQNEVFQLFDYSKESEMFEARIGDLEQRYVHFNHGEDDNKLVI